MDGGIDRDFSEKGLIKAVAIGYGAENWDGEGTTLEEALNSEYQPMIEIGGMPILWHIMKYYSSYGFNEFVICCGYKQHVIKDFFNDYFRI